MLLHCLWWMKDSFTMPTNNYFQCSIQLYKISIASSVRVKAEEPLFVLNILCFGFLNTKCSITYIPCSELFLLASTTVVIFFTVFLTGFSVVEILLESFGDFFVPASLSLSFFFKLVKSFLFFLIFLLLCDPSSSWPSWKHLNAKLINLNKT